MLLLLLAGFGPCDSDSSDTEVWQIQRPDGALARVTIHGGAIASDGEPQWTVLDNSGDCSFETPITGQMSGTAFDFTVEGGGCGGYQVQGTAMGQADGDFGAAVSAMGPLDESVQTPGGPINLNGTFMAARIE
jgi:hypothetical protein